jgi:antitoxin component of MazEF toxin-antitoxin module
MILGIIRVIAIGQSLGFIITASMRNYINLKKGADYQVKANDDGSILLTPVRKGE